MIDNKKKKDESGGSYFAVARRKRNRYMKIYIPIVAAIAIALGLVFAMGAQGGPMPGAKMVLHIHPKLNVTADGSPMIIPKNVGIDQSLWKDHSIDRYGMEGMAPLHTHDTSGTIHVESNTNRAYTLGQFLDIWGGLNLNGKTVKATVDGKPVSDYRNIVLKNGEQISLNVS
jgi:disulfide bond formation protein DsbB